MNNTEFNSLILISFDYFWKHCFSINDDYGKRFYQWIALTIDSCENLSNDTLTYMNDTIGECTFEVSENMHEVDRKWVELSTVIQKTIQRG